MEDAGTGFLRYESLLWRVQARLARDGYVIEPQDARDFMHDFYLEWDALTQRYRPQSGAFEPYLVTAFYQFCRRRFFKLSKLRNQTADLEAAAELPSAAPPIADALELKQQIDIVAGLVGALTDAEQAILHEFLGEHDYGERELARKHGLSRYRLREVLAELVGRIALQMVAPPYDSRDAGIVRGLWLEGQSAKTVAAMHGLTIAEVQAAKVRFSQALLRSVRMSDRPSPKRRKIMEDVLGVLKRAILSPDKASLEELNRHAAQVLQALDADQDIGFTEPEMELLRRSPETLAVVYDVLGASGMAPPQQAGALAAMDAVRGANEDIGQAWEILADQLDAEGFDWTLRLADVGVDDAGLLQHLAEDLSVIAGGAAARRLLTCGLTPAMLYEAFDNIRLLFNRTGRKTARQREADAGRRGVQLALLTGEHALVPGTRIQAQLAAVRDFMPVDDAENAAVGHRSSVLLRWIMRLLELHPFMIDGYAFDPAGNTFHQLPDYAQLRSWSADELVRRWCRPPAELERRLAGYGQARLS